MAEVHLIRVQTGLKPSPAMKINPARTRSSGSNHSPRSAPPTLPRDPKGTPIHVDRDGHLLFSRSTERLLTNPHVLAVYATATGHVMALSPSAFRLWQALPREGSTPWSLEDLATRPSESKKVRDALDGLWSDTRSRFIRLRDPRPPAGDTASNGASGGTRSGTHISYLDWCLYVSESDGHLWGIVGVALPAHE